MPYRDIMQAPNDVGENRIQFLLSSLASMYPLTQAGKIKVLAVTGRKRVPSLPDVPTVAEAGYPAPDDGKHRRHVRAAGHVDSRCATRSPPTSAR